MAATHFLFLSTDMERLEDRLPSHQIGKGTAHSCSIGFSNGIQAFAGRTSFNVIQKQENVAPVYLDSILKIHNAFHVLKNHDVSNVQLQEMLVMNVSLVIIQVEVNV